MPAASAVSTWNTSSTTQNVSRSAARTLTSVDSKVNAANAARAKAKQAAQTRAANAKAAAKRTVALAALSSSTKAQTHTEQPAQAPAQQQSGAAAAGATAAGGARKASVTTQNFASTGSGGYTCAIGGCGGIFTSGFGYRQSPGGIGSTNHGGIDLSVPIGTPLRAMHSGTVTAVGWYGGQGMRVNIDFGNGVSVVYAHMSSFAVSVGQQVSGGQVVGWSGNTGNSTGPHLHLEVHLGGVAVNPVPWLSARGLM